MMRALRARTAQLASYLQAWGACTVREYGGHPVKAWASTVPGLSTLHIATRYVAPLAEVLVTLPLFRAASPWRRGALAGIGGWSGDLFTARSRYTVGRRCGSGMVGSTSNQKACGQQQYECG